MGPFPLSITLRRYAWFREIQMSRAIRRFIRTQWHRPIWGEGLYGENVENALASYLSEPERKDMRLVKKLTRDMVKCSLLYGATPDEYFLFNFRNASDEVRASFVTDMDKDKTLMQTVDVKMYERELQDKYAFYKRAGEFFKREACLVAGVEDWDAFRQLAAHSADVFVKPLESSYGRGAASLHLETGEDARRAFDSLLEQGGKWIAEEKIRQSAVMARWNESSVNTVRMPSFRTELGYKLMTPYLKVGRAGSVVDNGGAGGIIINIDKETGELVTDGVREDNTVYAKHPDSGVPFKGERLPEWESLLELTRKVHVLFPPHRHIAFDFAHTEQGWVLIEGNWGQVGSQFVDKVGRKKEWHELMGC